MVGSEDPRLPMSATTELCKGCKNLKQDCSQQAQNKPAKSSKEAKQL